MYAAATIRKEVAVADDILSYFKERRLEVNKETVCEYLAHKTEI